MSRIPLFLLLHDTVGAEDVKPTGTCRDVKSIGLYTSRAGAEAAIGRVRAKAGFCDWPDGFRILEYGLDEDAFPDGFAPDCT